MIQVCGHIWSFIWSWFRWIGSDPAIHSASGIPRFTFKKQWWNPNGIYATLIFHLFSTNVQFLNQQESKNATVEPSIQRYPKIKSSMDPRPFFFWNFHWPPFCLCHRMRCPDPRLPWTSQWGRRGPHFLLTLAGADQCGHTWAVGIHLLSRKS